MKYRPKIKPWPHQAHGLKRLWKLKSALLWFKVRTGKTKVSVDYAAARHLAGQVDRVVIVCPPAVIGVWENEIRANVPDGIEFHIRSQNEWNRISEVVKAIDELEALHGLRFLIITYNTVVKYVKALTNFRPDLLVIDESHYIKHYKAARTKRVLALSRHATYVLCLSGTPAPNGHIDLYWQVKAINPLVLPPTMQEFKERYCVLDPWGNVVAYKNEDELAERLARVTVRAESPIQLPPVVDHEVPVVLDPQTRKVYEELKEHLTVTLQEGKESIDAHNPLTLLLRLAQITGGYLDGQPVGEQAKLKVLLELLENEQEKVVIWCRFLAEIKGILAGLKKLGKTCTYITGSVTGRERTERIRRFQQEPDPQILVCQAQSLSVGVDLTAASTSIFYSLDWNSETYEQARGRIHGPKQRETCHYVHLLARNTVDETIYAAVRRKMSRQQILAQVVEVLTR